MTLRSRRRCAPVALGIASCLALAVPASAQHSSGAADSQTAAIHVGAGAILIDCPDFCPEMVVIPPGEYTMGSPASETGRDDDEGPLHRVTLDRPFAVGRFEVTRGEYAAFSKETGRAVSGGCLTDRKKTGTWEADPRGNWTDPNFRQTDRDPVVCVSWDDAQAYVQWLSRKAGHTYRLLSEAEFEYVARAGTTTTYWWGPSADQGCANANGADTTTKAKYPDWKVMNCSDGALNTAPVGSYRPNPFGLYDITGNVSEWTEDCYNKTYVGVPQDGSAWGLGDCGLRVVRGGSWSNGPQFLRLADRDGRKSGERSRNRGFRVARTL